MGVKLMEDLGEFITVQELADAANVTKAGVYSRIKSGGLDEYIKVENGVRMVSVRAIKLFTPRKNSKVDKVEGGELSILVLEVEKEKEKVELLQSSIQTLTAQLSILESQLKVKDEQISKKDKQIDELNDLVKTITSLVDQSQRLNAIEKAEKMKSLAEDTGHDVAKSKKWYEFWK